MYPAQCGVLMMLAFNAYAAVEFVNNYVNLFWVVLTMIEHPIKLSSMLGPTFNVWEATTTFALLWIALSIRNSR